MTGPGPEAPPLTPLAPLARAALVMCFFVSGAAGLVYQVVWSRHLHLVFGSTSHSIATVVATYMLGLGLGSLLFGRIADSSPRPARLYALVEIAIGLYGLASPLLLGGVRHAFVAFYRAADPSFATGLVAKALLGGAVLAIPTLLMGGTLPLLARYLVARGSESGRSVGLLYGINTLGAVAGTALAGFVAIERLGLWGSIVAAAAGNFLAGVAVLALRFEAVPATTAAASEKLGAILARPGVRLATLLAALTGFAALVAEVAWARVLGLAIGSSTWGFTLVLVAFLLGIGLGSAIVARAGVGHNPALRLAWSQALAGAGVASLLVGLEPMLRVVVAFQQNPLTGFWGLLGFKGALALAAILPGTLGMGMSFPLVASLATRSRPGVGQEVGLVYAANTVGSIAGSALAGFVFLVELGACRTLKIAVVGHALAVLVALAAASGPAFRPARAARAAAALSALLLAALAGLAPRWPVHLLSSGAFLYARDAARTPAELEQFLARGGHQLLHSVEGLTSVVSVHEADYVRALRVNGKTDASTSADVETQVLVALLPALAHPAPRDVLVIGAGAGITVRAIAAVPGVRSIDLVEIEPEVMDAGSFFESVNGGVYRDPRVRVIVEDGRNFLLTTHKRYDLILSVPSNPWMSGVANLFTTGYYELVREHLTPDGLLGQWLQRYDTTPDTFRRNVATLLASFPEAQLWRSGGTDLVLLLGNGRIAMRPELVREVVEANGAWWRDLALQADFHAPEDLLAGLVLDRAGLEAFARGSRPFTDDRPELEFAALRSLGRHEWLQPLTFQILAARRARPPTLLLASPLAPGFDDYALGRVLESWSDPAAAAERYQAAAEASPGEAVRWRRLGQARLAAGDRAGAAAAWQRAVETDPGDARSWLALADSALATGDVDAAEQALGRIPDPLRDLPERLTAAELRARRDDAEGALRELRAALPRLPFARDPVASLERALTTVARVAEQPGGLEPALALMDGEAERSPRVLSWRYEAARLLERAGRAGEAIPRYQAALVEGPDLRALLGQARCYARLGKGDAARAMLARVHRFEPWNAEAERITIALDSAAAAGAPSR